MQCSPVSLVAIALLAAAGCAPRPTPAAGLVVAREPAPAHEIDATYLSGEGPRTLADARGRVVVVQFWATYCDPCKRSFPKYQQLVDQFEGQLVVLGVSVDEPGDDARHALGHFVQETPVRFPLLWDEGGATRQAYRPRHLPTSYVIDQQGAVRFVHARYEAGTDEQIASEVRSLLE
jgi:peroxiredoxin